MKGHSFALRLTRIKDAFGLKKYNVKRPTSDDFKAIIQFNMCMELGPVTLYTFIGGILIAALDSHGRIEGWVEHVGDVQAIITNLETAKKKDDLNLAHLFLTTQSV